MKGDHFIAAVRILGELPSDEAVRHPRVVATVVRTAVTAGEIDDARSQLGNEYEELFGRPSA